MERRGPKRLVTNAVRVGDYGESYWFIELDCNHSLQSKRKPKVSEDSLCCKLCAPGASNIGTEVSLLPISMSQDYDLISEVKLKAAIASRIGVPLDQVEIFGETASVFIDAEQLRRFI